MKFKFRKKFGVSEGEIKEIRVLAESLREASGAETVETVAKLSDEKLETYLSTARERNRRKAIRRMWELEEWFSGKS